MLKRENLVGAILFLTIAIIIVFTNSTNVNAKNTNSESQTKITKKKQLSDADKLALIDKYQEKYFTIIKRNGLFYNVDDTAAVEKDRKELNNLYKEVKKQIKNKDYLKKYKEIEKRYSNCKEETTIGMNQFAESNYNEVDDLLNTVYKDVQSKISPQDFNKLTESEKIWLKEVNDYQKMIDLQGFGTIGTIMYYDYQVDIRSFRTLLLMLYL